VPPTDAQVGDGHVEHEAIGAGILEDDRVLGSRVRDGVQQPLHLAQADLDAEIVKR